MDRHLSDFVIRPASTLRGDGTFILKAHDSALPYLASIGSQQWGSEPFSERASATDKIHELVRQSEQSREEGNSIRAFVAERKLDEPPFVVRCGAVIIEELFPTYVTSQQHLRKHISQSVDTNNFIYLSRLVTDRSIPRELCRGAGKTLLEYIKEVARRLDKLVIFSDCYAGPPTGLVE